MRFQEQSYRAVAAFEPLALGSRYLRMVFFELDQPARPPPPKQFECLNRRPPPPLWQCNPLAEREADDSYTRKILRGTSKPWRAVIALPLTAYETFMQAPTIGGAITLALELVVGLWIATALTSEYLERRGLRPLGLHAHCRRHGRHRQPCRFYHVDFDAGRFVLFGWLTRLAMLALAVCPALYLYAMNRLEHATKRAAQKGVHSGVDKLFTLLLRRRFGAKTGSSTKHRG